MMLHVFVAAVIIGDSEKSCSHIWVQSSCGLGLLVKIWSLLDEKLLKNCSLSLLKDLESNLTMCRIAK